MATQAAEKSLERGWYQRLTTSIAWPFCCEISVQGISHLRTSTPKSTISEPYKPLRISKTFIFWWVQFRTVRPELGFGHGYQVDSHGQLALKQLRLSVLMKCIQTHIQVLD
jgi:hypothetical protein